MIIELFDNGFDQIIFTGVFTLYLETFRPGLPTDIIALITNSIISNRLKCAHSSTCMTKKEVTQEASTLK